MPWLSHLCRGQQGTVPIRHSSGRRQARHQPATLQAGRTITRSKDVCVSIRTHTRRSPQMPPGNGGACSELGGHGEAAPGGSGHSQGHPGHIKGRHRRWGQRILWGGCRLQALLRTSLRRWDCKTCLMMDADVWKTKSPLNEEQEGNGWVPRLPPISDHKGTPAAPVHEPRPTG